MNFRTATIHCWDLSTEEDEAVTAAIRHYLESPQSSDAASNRREVVLQGVLQGRQPQAFLTGVSLGPIVPVPQFNCGQDGCYVNGPHTHHTVASAAHVIAQGHERQPPIILPTKPQPGAFICPNLRCFVEAPHAQTDPICGSAPPPGPPTMLVVEAAPLTDEQKARIAAEAAKVQGHAGGATRLATWEGADK